MEHGAAAQIAEGTPVKAVKLSSESAPDAALLPPLSPADKVFSALAKDSDGVLTREKFDEVYAAGLLRLGDSAEVEMNSIAGPRWGVPITAEPGIDLQIVLAAQVFVDWIADIDKDPKLFCNYIHVQSLDMFGPRVGFIKFHATAQVNVGGEKGIITVPGIVFMRGGAVGVLVILECDGKEFTLLTKQARVPVGLSELAEIPAGMLDGSGHFKGVAAEEIAEECNIVISEEELVDLTELAWGDRYKGMLPSAGGCDEFLKLFVFRRAVEPAVLSGEHIKLQIIPLEDLWKSTPDAKALGALALFDYLRAQGTLPESVQHADTKMASMGVAELDSAESQAIELHEDKEVLSPAGEHALPPMAVSSIDETQTQTRPRPGSAASDGTNEGSRTSHSPSHSTSRSSTRGKPRSAFTSRRSGRVSGAHSSTARGLQEVVKAKDEEIEELKAKLAQFEAAAAAAAADRPM